MNEKFWSNICCDNCGNFLTKSQCDECEPGATLFFPKRLLTDGSPNCHFCHHEDRRTKDHAGEITTYSICTKCVNGSEFLGIGTDEEATKRINADR
jgi:cytochrome c peroxidase